MASKAVILVGGPSRGTRFRPLSLDVPKPLFPVAGYPLIFHHLLAIEKVPTVKEVILIGFYEESIFRSFIKDASDKFDFSLKYMREYEALGTAGGLYLFRDAILKNNPSEIFVLHADVCCSFPLKDMQAMHNAKTGVGVILGTKIAPEAASNFGCIVSNLTTNVVLHYVEKPETYISNTINCGVYLFSTEALFKIIRASRAERFSNPPQTQLEQNFNLSDEEPDERLRLEQDILAPLSQTQQLFVYHTKDFWHQIKTAGSAVPANALYLQQALQWQETSYIKLVPASTTGPEIVVPVYIHPSAIIAPTAKLGPNVSISANVRIHDGARIKDALILDGAEIKHNACILHSIVGWDAKIGAWARVEGTPTLASQYCTTIMRGGAKVQSITILAKDVHVGDETRCQNVIVLPNKDIKFDVSNEVIVSLLSSEDSSNRRRCNKIGQ